MLTLFDHQQEAVDNLKDGSILRGGVGSGKSLTAIAYVIQKHLKNDISKMNLYIITTARKRDTNDWDEEVSKYLGVKDDPIVMQSVYGYTVDSWNNIKKYKHVRNAFFIFDEQRLVGSGAWVKSFLEIAKSNKWILLSATPGDTWMDYIPVFIANGFYKNRTAFIREHVKYCRFVKYPKVERYLNTGILLKHKNEITVDMPYERKTISHHKDVFVKHDKDKMKKLVKERWNIYDDAPIKDAAELFRLMRKLNNSDKDRIHKLKELYTKHKKIIVFYNFNYELEILRDFCKKEKINYSEWNGHKHQDIPRTNTWIYLVQYTAGAEGWNCVSTDTVVFYSLNYSYKVMKQSSGRINRMNTKFVDLYYYYFKSKAMIDMAIDKALKDKKNFHEKDISIF